MFNLLIQDLVIAYWREHKINSEKDYRDYRVQLYYIFCLVSHYQSAHSKNDSVWIFIKTTRPRLLLLQYFFIASILIAPRA